MTLRARRGCDSATEPIYALAGRPARSMRRANTKGRFRMVANYQAERAAHGFDYNEPPVARPRSRQYDSFVIRLWQDEGSDSMLRVELQHVQAGLSIEAVQVPLDWIVPEIMGCLKHE
jgi:hypothetical protein